MNFKLRHLLYFRLVECDNVHVIASDNGTCNDITVCRQATTMILQFLTQSNTGKGSDVSISTECVNFPHHKTFSYPHV